MTKLSIFAAAAALLAVLPSSADAQYARRLQPSQLEDGEILVQAQRSLTIRPGQGDTAKQQDDAVKLIYKMAERECGLILETIGSACELAGIATNVSTNESGEQVTTIRASGNFQLKIRLKQP